MRIYIYICNYVHLWFFVFSTVCVCACWMWLISLMAVLIAIFCAYHVQKGGRAWLPKSSKYRLGSVPKFMEAFRMGDAQTKPQAF